MSKIRKGNILGLLFKSAMRLKVFSFLLFSLIVALPASISAGTIELPRTGQTKCYNASGTEITCTGTGQDGEIQAGVAWPDPRFEITYCNSTGPCAGQGSDCDGNSSNDIVTDKLTGLIWPRNGNLPNGTKTWDQALTYADNLTLCGYSDWYLPNINELESLVNAGQSSPATWFNGQGFANVQSNYYWSSTTVAGSTGDGWYIYMGSGSVNGADKSNISYAWPVRAGQSGSLGNSVIWQTGQTTSYYANDDGALQKGVNWPSPRFADNGNTVTDGLTGLIWTKDANAPGPSACSPATYKTWQAALDYVKCLNTNSYLGYNDWRLPNRKELRSFSDYSKFNPALLTGNPFANVQSSYYWLSTTSAYNTYYAWYVDMSSGSVRDGSKSNSYYVWPVRGGKITAADTTPPTGTISVNSGAASTTSTSVTLTLTCADTGGSCSEMQFSNDNSTWSTAETYSTTKSWTLTSGNGTKTVYVKFKDNSGNWSSAYSDTIDLSTCTYSIFPTSQTFTSSAGTGNVTVTTQTGCAWTASEGLDWVSITSGSSGTGSGTVGYSVTANTATSSRTGNMTIAGQTFTITQAAANILTTTASPAGGTYQFPLTVALSCNNSAATIYYTTDGTTPTIGSNVYSSALTIRTRTTLKFFAKDTSGNTESVKTETYSSIGDSVYPAINITSPQNGSSQEKLYSISGTASDSGSGIYKVELQITDGTYYVNSSGQFVTTPTWLTPDGTDTWSYNTSLVNWANSTTYTINARATDGAGNISNTSITFKKVLKIEQAYTTLSLDLSSQTILQNATITASGKLTRLPDNGDSLTGLTITLTITSPTGITTTQTTTTYDTYGHYKITNVSGFTQKGTYTLKASFAGTTMLASSESEAKIVLVGTSAGYAIIVQGKITTQEGISSHNKTTKRIYETLKERGFIDDNIYYFNYNTSQTGVDASPTKNGIQYAIETWAKGKMNGSAAPLYILMVDHGNTNAFYIGSETITPTDLNTWINTLDGGLNTTAKAEKKVIVIGACYSGSFIPAISKTGRVIITSSAGDEESYKGPNEPDGVRSGEYFLEELFKELKKGNSIKTSFENATDKTEKFTRKDGKSSNRINKYCDDATQHPLLDDNGDGIGSNILSADSGDGTIAKNLYLGTGKNYDTNATDNEAEITTVTDTAYLNENTTTALLWAKVDDNSRASSVWIEIRTPSKTLITGGGSGQLELDLQRELMTYNASTGRWEKTYSSFTENGIYEVFYFVKDSFTSEISPMKRSVVYKNKTGNSQPNTFNLVSPEDISEQKTVLQLDWEEAKDPDGNNVTYTVMISKDSAFSTIAYTKEEITYSSTEIGTEANLSDLTTYYWKVRAVDSYGATRDSTQTWYFTTNNTNGLPGIIKGYIKNETTGLGIANATISSSTGGNTKTLPNGKYVLFTDSGTLTLIITKTGYTSKTETATISPGELLTKNISLVPQTGAMFKDISSSSVFYSYTNAIYQADITVGCGSSNYCPDSNVTRGQMSAFIIRALYGEDFNYTTTPYFTDVPSTNTFFKYVQKLKDDGLTSLSGTYNVDSYVTRGQMAAFIVRALYGESFTYTTTPYFTDVPSGNVFFTYVQKLKDEGITVTTGKYNVDSYVTREQMSAFISRAFLGME